MNLLDKLQFDEGIRIQQLIKDYDEYEAKLYLNAYADALEYAEKIMEAKGRDYLQTDAQLN